MMRTPQNSAVCACMTLRAMLYTGIFLIVG